MAPQEVGIELGRGDVRMAEQLLHHAQIGTTIEQVRRKGVAQGMRMDLRAEPCALGSGANDRPGCLTAEAGTTSGEEKSTLVGLLSDAAAARLLVDGAPRVDPAP